MPAWSLALRFVLELAALVGLALLGLAYPPHALAVVLAVVLPVAGGVAWGVFGFFVVHVVLVLLSGPLRQVRDMITGGRIDEAA